MTITTDDFPEPWRLRGPAPRQPGYSIWDSSPVPSCLVHGIAPQIANHVLAAIQATKDIPTDRLAGLDLAAVLAALETARGALQRWALDPDEAPFCMNADLAYCADGFDAGEACMICAARGALYRIRAALTPRPVTYEAAHG